MKKLLYINACIRGEQSRTKAVATPILRKLGMRYDITEIDLTATSLLPLDAESYKAREAGIHPSEAVAYAKALAEADRVVIAMPFWDMSFPAVFKVFCEHVSLNGITFTSDAEGRLFGECVAERVLLITTRGADIEDFGALDQASSYIKAVSALWGLGELFVISAIGMDACDDETRARRLDRAIEQGLLLCEDF